mmetsp:Transcript_27949/g.69126  ORF Transcript_27949/g.69126 Transcript_27949/m.69126 type:complete len:343 (-) Transcript_27949:1029-2057(-)
MEAVHASKTTVLTAQINKTTPRMPFVRLLAHNPPLKPPRASAGLPDAHKHSQKKPVAAAGERREMPLAPLRCHSRRLDGSLMSQEPRDQQLVRHRVVGLLAAASPLRLLVLVLILDVILIVIRIGARLARIGHLLLLHGRQPKLPRGVLVAEEAQMDQHRPRAVHLAPLLPLRQQAHLAGLQKEPFPGVAQLTRRVPNRVHAPRPHGPATALLRRILLRVPACRQLAEPVVRRGPHAGAHAHVAHAREGHLVLAPVVHAEEDLLVRLLDVEHRLEVGRVRLVRRLDEHPVAPPFALCGVAQLHVELGRPLAVLGVQVVDEGRSWPLPRARPRPCPPVPRPGA